MFNMKALPALMKENTPDRIIHRHAKKQMVFGTEPMPLLHILRLVKQVRIIRLLRVKITLGILKSFWASAFRIARRAHIDVLAAAAAVVIVGAAGTMWLIEADFNASFVNMGDSLWWAVNMFANVAYVEFHPATFGGRMVAMVLEFSGIAFIGLFAASLAGALLTDKLEEGVDLPPAE